MAEAKRANHIKIQGSTQEMPPRRARPQGRWDGFEGYRTRFNPKTDANLQYNGWDPNEDTIGVQEQPRGHYNRFDH